MSMPPELSPIPTRVYVQRGDVLELAPAAPGGRASAAGVRVTCVPGPGGTAVSVACGAEGVTRVVLRWEVPLPGGSLILGDAWERGYGDLQWRHLQPERVLPWMWAAHDAASGHTFSAGVMTGGSAFAAWTVDADGVSLWLDLRNGGGPSFPGDREVPAATVVSRSSGAGESPLAALRELCRRLCPAPRLAPGPVCGNNNWYYAYGVGFDADAMRRDARFLAELAAGHRVLPYCVIDAGWTPGTVCPGGPWEAGDPNRFPDMPGLAADMRAAGVRPGIWIRPTALMTVDRPSRLRAGPQPAAEKALDLTLEENLAGIREDLARVRAWGYELIKHDFSTYDAFARWGFEMGLEMTEPGWHWSDRSRTNAEVILRLYRELRAGAGDAVLLGCNTAGHLGAGLFEVQRTGDDTSGRLWERTRRMGVNTLAFRMHQHGTFFAADADCAAHTPRTPWEQDRQFLDLVARSGTSLFLSADPRTTGPEQRAAFSSALRLSLDGGEAGFEPVDWLQSTAPRRYRSGGREVAYRWEEPQGAWPFRI